MTSRTLGPVGHRKAWQEPYSPRFVLGHCGSAPGAFATNIYDLVVRAITLRGTIVCTRHDAARALDLAAQRGIRATVHPAKLSSINSILDKMAAWPMPGRVGLEFPKSTS